MNDIKISIIVPIYNVEKYIDRCLDSLVNQTLKEIEIIIVNDKTPDNSMEICEKYAEKDHRIKIYNKDENEGLGYTRNYGINKANGEFIAFVDSDDYVDKDFYEKLYNKAIETNTDICFGEFKTYNSKNENDITTIKIPFKNDVENTKDILYNMILRNQNERNLLTGYINASVWQAIYTKSIINENNILFISERKYLAEDVIFNFEYLMQSKKASFVRGAYYYYCFNESSLTHTYIQNRMEKVKVQKNKLIELAKKYGELEFFLKAIMSKFLADTRKTIKQEINCNESRKEKIENIKRIVNDTDLRMALKNKMKDNFFYEILDFFIKTKQVRLLIIIYQVANKLKGKVNFMKNTKNKIHNNK